MLELLNLYIVSLQMSPISSYEMNRALNNVLVGVVISLVFVEIGVFSYYVIFILQYYFFKLLGFPMFRF